MTNLAKPWSIKLERANNLILGLAAEIDGYLAQRHARIEITRSADTFELRLRVSQTPPDMWSAVIGDVLHNMRSALDAITFEVVQARAATPLTKDQLRRIQFPITDTRARFETWAKTMLRSGDDEALTIFSSVQPWRDLEHSSEPAADIFRYHPLTRLQRLSNHDKHRSLHPTICAPDLMYVGLPDGASSTWDAVDSWPWQDGSVMARCTILGLKGASPEFGDQFAVGLTETASPFSNTPATSHLSGMLGHVHWIVSCIDHELRSSISDE